MINLPTTKEDFLVLLRSARTDFIRTEEQWKAYLAQIADDESHVLKGIDADSIDRFGATMIFRNGGLAGCSYEALKDKLSQDQLMMLFENFGISKALFTDYYGFACKIVNGCASCYQQQNAICTSACGGCH